MRWINDVSFKTLFTHPFKREVFESEAAAEFNVTRCPFAEYLIEQGAAELTAAAACNLDYRMAKTWGAKFQRSQTIATDAAHCDFKYTVTTD